MDYLKLEDLTLEQKLGILLCARRWDAQEDIDFTLELIKNHALGCVQIPFNSKTSELVKKIKEVADYPIIIVNDMEKGYPRCDLPKVSALTLAACAKDEYYKAFAKGIVKYAKAAGFNGAWGPVVDILRENVPAGVSRCYGDNPESVTNAAEIISKVFMDNGFFATGKHYPGGSEPYDTHMAEGFSPYTEKELLEFDLVPYIELNNKGLLPAVMTIHSTFTNIDPDYPATLSKKMLGILRNQGFDGVYFTDSLAMMGILQKYGEENAYGICIDAGNDILLTNYRTPTKTCYEMLKNCYEKGMFTDERLDEAVRHVLALQKWIGEHADIEGEFTDNDLELLESVTKDCITAVCDEGLSANIGDPDKRRIFVVVTPMDFDDSEISMEINDRGWYKPVALSEHIKATFKNSEVAFIPEYPTPKQNEELLVKATDHDEIVFVTYCQMGCYIGTDSLTKRIEALINCVNISGKVSAIVHFGNPYAMEPLDHMKRVIFGYNSTESQKYAFDVLAGKIPAKGKLPINLNLK